MIPLRQRTASLARRLTPTVAACLICLAALTAPGSAIAQHWTTLSDKDGVRVESRGVPGERFDELRISTSMQASPEAVADYLFGKYLDERNRNIRRTFILRDRDITIWSDVLSTPVISDRCYSMRFERYSIANGGVRVKFESIHHSDAKPTPDCVPLRSRGEWVMTPVAGGTRLIYQSLTDIGGNVPVALARRSLFSAAILSVRKVAAGSSGRALPRGIGD